jgi:hypothetical protein
MISLVQSFLGTNGSTTNTTPFTQTLTATFPNPVTAGHCLVVFAAQNVTATTSGNRETATVLTSVPGGPAANWRGAVGNTVNVSSTQQQQFQILYLQNCPALTTSDSITVSFVFAGSGVSHTITSEFAVYEFSGVLTAANPSNVVDTTRSPAASTGTPSAGNIILSFNDLLMAAYTGNTGNIVAGSGYTLGINMTVATFAQLQYQLNVTPGTYATAFVGTESNYGAGAVGLKAAASTGALAFGSLFGF